MRDAFISLSAIRAKSPCESGWRKLLAGLGKTKADDEPLSLLTVLEINGLDDAFWCLRALPESMDNRVRLLTCDIAERALRFVPAGEDRPRGAIETARLFAAGAASREDLAAARDAARDAAGDAARDAAWDAAWAAARAAAWAAARAAAWAAAWDAAWDAEREEQRLIFIRHVTSWEMGRNMTLEALENSINIRQVSEKDV